MSDYVRIKAVRFKIPTNVIEKIVKENKDDWIYDLLTKKYGVRDCYETPKNEFTVNGGYNFKNEKMDYFLDFLLDYEYVANGEFESVRLLTDNEFEKYSKKFAIYFNEISRDELRLVHYSYYNGVDEPSVYEVEEV